MKKLFLIFIFPVILLSPTLAFGQKNKAPIDYLSVSGPIVFEKQSYYLSWTSHPTANFYKHEYLPQSEAASRYNTMILLDVLTGNQNIKDVVASKTSELKKMKETNPVVNYEALENPKNGEYMIDFLLSQSTPDGKAIGVVERNVYRYKVFTDKSGKKGILLFGVSTRSYGNDVNKFLARLRSDRNYLINSVSKFKIPDVSITE
jgi:hypothetical protein